MKRFQSRHGVVTLTDERLGHILEFHPDVKVCLQYFAGTLAAPDYEIMSSHDASVIICYRLVPKKRRYLAIVVKAGKRPFILTAYLAKKPKGATLEP